VGEAKFAILHWWAQSPLTLGWRHYAATDKPVSFGLMYCDRCQLFIIFMGPSISLPFFRFLSSYRVTSLQRKRTLMQGYLGRCHPECPCGFVIETHLYAFSTLTASDERWQQPWIYFITGDWIYYCKSTWNEKLKSTRKHLWELLLGQLFVCAAHIKHIFIHRVTWQWRNFVPYLC